MYILQNHHALIIPSHIEKLPFNGLFQDNLDKLVPERQNHSGFYWSKRRWVAVASA